MNNRRLITDQIDRKLVKLSNLRGFEVPPIGWVHSIRVALRMSLAQLGKRLGISAPSAKDIEERERNGTISINALKRVGAALNMDFVYGFVPKAGTLDKMIEVRANEIAQKIVRRTTVSMKLEDQENSPSRIRNAVKEKTEEIKQEMPRYLWD
jgi:predicted DNA-binding mobile mystery protein A